MEQRSRSIKIWVTLIICLTIVALAGISSWVYVQHQNTAQRDKQAQLDRDNSVKKLKYQECQTNNRAAETSNNAFSSLSVKNCDLIL